jgi:hypothetical protein
MSAGSSHCPAKNVMPIGIGCGIRVARVSGGKNGFVVRLVVVRRNIDHVV